MIKVSDLCLRKSKVQILKSVHFSLETPSFVGVFGPNGAGKSSFLRSLAGLEDVGSQVFYRERSLNSLPLDQRAKLVSWLPSQLEVPFDLKVSTILQFGRFAWNKGHSNRKDQEVLLLTLEALAAKSLLDRSFSSLSSGEQKLVLIARTLCQDTPYVLLDEPCAHLDLEVSLRVLNYLKRLVLQGKTVLASLHDLTLSRGLLDRSLIFSNGACYEAGQDGINPNLLKKFFNVDSQWICNDTGRHLIIKPQGYN